jgi:hypothetical protein
MVDSKNDVVVQVTAGAAIDQAFAVFTQRIEDWWPRAYRLGPSERVDTQIEPQVGGRWYEQTEDGQQADWGQVLVWDAPCQVSLSWQLTPYFSAEPDPGKASRVDVIFKAVDEARTLVTVTHSDLGRHGEGWEQMRDAVAGEGGWPGIMRAYADLASRR